MKINFLSKSIDQSDFVSRTAIVAATVAVSFVLWKLTELLPAVFATILIALAWRGVAEQVSARLGLSEGLSLAVVALGSLASIVMALMLFGGQLLRQYDEIALDVPAAIALIERMVEEHPWARFVEKFWVHVDFSKMTNSCRPTVWRAPRIARKWTGQWRFRRHRRRISRGRSKTICRGPACRDACVEADRHGAVS